jgi:hypothetical protein
MPAFDSHVWQATIMCGNNCGNSCINTRGKWLICICGKMSGYSRANGRGKSRGNHTEKIVAKYEIKFAANSQIQSRQYLRQ